MSLPLLYAQPNNDAAWSAWSFNHGAIHNTLIGVIGVQKQNYSITQYCLDPINRDSLGYWLYQHQTAHNQINLALGTQGYDLLSFDWEDPDEFQQWLQLNGDEHLKFSTILGVD